MQNIEIIKIQYPDNFFLILLLSFLCYFASMWLQKLYLLSHLKIKKKIYMGTAKKEKHLTKTLRPATIQLSMIWDYIYILRKKKNSFNLKFEKFRHYSLLLLINQVKIIFEVFLQAITKAVNILFIHKIYTIAMTWNSGFHPQPFVYPYITLF